MIVNNAQKQLYILLIQEKIDSEDFWYKEMNELVTEFYRKCTESTLKLLNSGLITESEFDAEIDEYESIVSPLENREQEWQNEKKILLVLMQTLRKPT